MTLFEQERESSQRDTPQEVNFSCNSRFTGQTLPSSESKNDLGRKQGAPFARGVSVGRRPADEFVAAFEVPDEAGGTKPGDRGGLKNEGVGRCQVHAFYFHATSVTQALGRWRSNPKNKSAKENSMRAPFLLTDGAADSNPEGSLVRQLSGFNIFFAISYYFARSKPTLAPGDIC
jgi:hypothetical protein